MKARLSWVTLLCLALGVAGWAVPASADSNTTTTRVLVTVNKSSNASSTVQHAADAVNANVDAKVNSKTFVLGVGKQDVTKKLTDLRNENGVVSAEPELQYKATLTPNDPCLTTCFGVQEWAPAKVGAPRAWDATTGNASIEVAVLDTGVTVSNPDLTGKIEVGPAFAPSNLGCGGSVIDHATHVAGIIAAATNNAVGVAGMGFNTHVLSIKVLDDFGCGNQDTISSGITYAADQPNVKVINLSLGGSTNSSELTNAVTYAENKGKVVVAAAGNDGTTALVYPAALAGVVSVASTDQNDAISSFSNRGSWVDMAAPGEGIISTYQNGYAIGDGTSAAAPYVSGTAALIYAANPSFTASDVIHRILTQSTPISGTGTSVIYGRLNAGNAVNPENIGYWSVAADGGVFSFGPAPFFGSTGNIHLNKPISGMTATTTGNGYWFVASDGGVFSYGDAGFFGSTGNIHLNKPIVGMTATADGNGYWLVASDGGIFAFGDAAFYGSTGNVHLNKPIVGMTATADGKGYWLVASDGGIFSFGDAAFYGSTGNISLNKPIVGMTRTVDGKGYWFVASDGGLFSYGDAVFYGSLGGATFGSSVVGMASTPDGGGYWMAAANGSAYAFGDAPFQGAVSGLNQPIVGMTARP